MIDQMAGYDEHVGVDARVAQRLRVVVVGNSVAFYVRPRRTSVGEGPYGELLEEALREQGYDASVTNQAGWMMQVHEITPEIEPRVLVHAPDVVIVNVGWLECQPRVMPTAVLKWLYTWRPSLNPAARMLRRRAEPIVRRFYERWSPRLIRALPWPMHRLPPRRFEQELERLIDVIRGEWGCLVLVLNVNPTSDRVERALPGVQDHAAAYSRIIGRVVSKAGDGVRLVDTRSVVVERGVDAVLPDGIHFNAEGHRVVASMLRGEVEDWLSANFCRARRR